jgi:hypothetical protein
VYQTVETGVGFVYREPQAVPGSTHVLMTAAPDILWSHCLAVPANGFRELCDDLHAYDRRERAHVEFGAALHPEIFSTFRSDSSLFVQTGLSDGQHTSSLLPETAESSRFTLFKDGELVATRDGVFAFFAVPDGPGRFRLEQEWTLTDGFPRSRHARTAWTFDSAPGVTPPFITVDYGAEVDELGRAAPRKPLRLNLRFGKVTRIDEMRLQWSVDGGDSWSLATAARTGPTTFRASIPGLASGRQISLRVVAVDPAESEVDQTVYGIVPVG